jgi:hypothetical protein
MKKKPDQKKKSDMPEFEFKQFTPEEDRIYEEAVSAYRAALDAGKSLKDAYAAYTFTDSGLEKLVQVDFLKIVIAERHFGKNQSLEEIARALAVPNDLISDTKKRMLQEAGVTASVEAGRELGSLAPGEPQTND